MIYLYESTETDFRYNGKPLPLAYQVSVHFTVNAEFYVTGKYPLDDKGVYKEIIEDRIVKVHTPHGMEPFRIMSAPKSDTYVEFEAWPLFYADMRNKLVKPLNLRNATGQTAINQFVNNLLIDTPFQFYSNIQGTHDYHTQDGEERENNPNQFYDALEVFSDIVRRWNGEVRIRGYDIRINDSIGIDTEEMLYERKNIASFVDSTNIEGIVTRVHGKSEWIEEAQEGEEEGQKRSIQATVDSPLINEYSGIIFEKQYTNNNLRTEKEMENWLNLKFTTDNIDKPKRTIEVGADVIGNSRINAGDTLILKYVKHDVDVRIKVVGYEYDGMGNEYINFVFGEPKTSSASTIGNSITDIVNNIVRPVERKALEARASANSKNTNFYGKEEPTGTGIQKGDLWYKPIGDETEMYIYNGTIWELIVSTAVNNEIDRRIKDAKEIAEDSALRANEAYGRVQKAIDDAEEAYDYADSALESANEKNTVYRGVSKPSSGEKGDIWFRETTDGWITHVHNGTDFEESALDGKSIAGVINFGDVTALNFDANAITTGNIQIDRGLKVVNNGQDVLKVENGNVVMDVDNLLIKSSVSGEGFDNQVNTAIYQDNQAIGLIYEEDGQTKSLIHLGPDGPYLSGENIVLNGDTIVNGSFTVTDEIFAENMNISKFKVGTLNGAEVNLINLNADNIVTGTIRSQVLENSGIATFGQLEGTKEGLQDEISKTKENLKGEISKTDREIRETIDLTKQDIEGNFETTLNEYSQIEDTRDVNRPPSWYQSNYPKKNVREFKRTAVMGIGASLETYGVLITEVPWGDESGGRIKQSFHVSDKLYTRSGSESSWSAWRESPNTHELATSGQTIINGDNITTGKVKDQHGRTVFDLTNGDIRFNHTDGTYTRMGRYGIERFTGGDNRSYHYLISIHTFIYGESSSNARWIQLPDDFKGKQFKVYLAMADSMSVANYNRVLQRFVATKHPNHNIDIAGARVPVIAYKSESLGDGTAPSISNVQGMLIAIY